MYIITKTHGVFNTDCIPEISTDGVHVFAHGYGNPRPISYTPETLTTIIEALKNGADFVEVE